MKKQPKPKPVLAWAIVRDGKLNPRLIFLRHGLARCMMVLPEDGDHLLRVEIRPAPTKRKAKRPSKWTVKWGRSVMIPYRTKRKAKARKGGGR